jgi:hypothetical protein
MVFSTARRQGDSGHVSEHNNIARRLNGMISANEYRTLQNAIDAASGRTLFIPQGTYELDTGLTVSNPMTIIGDRATLTGAGLTLLTITVNDVHVSGLKFITAAKGIYIDEAHWTRIQGCWFDYLTTGVHAELSNATSIEGNRFDVRADNAVGVIAESSNAVNVVGNWFEHAKNGATFVKVYGAMSRDNVIAFNRFEGLWDLDAGETASYMVEIVANFPEPTVWKPDKTRLIANQMYPQQTSGGEATVNHDYDVSDGGDNTVVLGQ